MLKSKKIKVALILLFTKNCFATTVFYVMDYNGVILQYSSILCIKNKLKLNAKYKLNAVSFNFFFIIWIKSGRIIEIQTMVEVINGKKCFSEFRAENVFCAFRTLKKILTKIDFGCRTKPTQTTRVESWTPE